ncbi:hypothetical protein BpHYR1_015450 [Brachionus plicatilis]|uniref:Uncharacterized protein n=1 Tax=Brachionus plicatilis TaxID=10195 RepID=A0A3M7SFK0_BRAPC|nr:hypothetical protein BpHYR1_015450 [Brachionus plicatilis]
MKNYGKKRFLMKTLEPFLIYRTTPSSSSKSLISLFNDKNSKFIINLTKAILSSIKANFMPIQFLGPFPKAINASGFLFTSCLGG